MEWLGVQLRARVSHLTPPHTVLWEPIFSTQPREPARAEIGLEGQMLCCTDLRKSCMWVTAQTARKQHCPGTWARGHIHLWSGIGVPGAVPCSGVIFCSCCALTLCWLQLLWEIVRLEDKAFTLRGFLVENLGRLYRRSLGTQDSCAL